MIHGIGIDIVDIRRVRNVLERWGGRFSRRVFTEEEIAYCRDKAHAASSFAARFAAKEAFSKALGLGFRDGLWLKHIEVVREPHGRPHLRLHARAKELCEERRIKSTFLSLSDDGCYAVAMVVLEV